MAARPSRKKTESTQALPAWAHKSILEELHEGVIIAADDGSFRFMNRAAAVIYDYDTPEQFEKQLDKLGSIFELRTYPNKQLLAEKDWPIRLLQNGSNSVQRTLFVSRRDTGHERIVEYSGKRIAETPAKDGQGSQSAYMLLGLRDVTTEKQLEIERAADYSRQAAFFNSALDAIITLDSAGIISEFNPAAERIFGYSRGEAIGHEMAGLIIPPAYREAHRKGMARYVASGIGPIMGQLLEITALHRSGHEFPVELFVTRIGESDPPMFMGTLRDITGRKLAERATQDSEKRFRFMAEAMPQKIFTATPEGKIDYYNPQWEVYTGVPVTEIQKRGLNSFIHPQDRVYSAKLWRESLASGEPYELEHRFRKADGSYEWHFCRAHALRDDEGNIVMWIGSNVNVEEIRQRQELEKRASMLTEQRQQLMALNNAKDEFIAIASHQLRTPATGVKQYVGMLLQGYFGEPTEEQMPMLRAAYNSNERQLAIINALLNVARLDSGKVALTLTACDLGTFIEDIAREQTEVFRLRKQTLTIYTPSRPVIAHVDTQMLRMVIENLVDNAGKYTPDGKAVEIRISRTPKAVSIAIRDQGVGIRKKDQERLFQKFSRIDNELSSTASGSGLGLYWAKKIMDLHGGHIDVTSKARQGATFTVILPIKPAKKPTTLTAYQG